MGRRESGVGWEIAPGELGVRGIWGGREGTGTVLGPRIVAVHVQGEAECGGE